MHQHTARSLLACVLIAAASAINSQAQLASDMIDSPLKLDIASQQTVGKSTTTLLRSPDISRADIEFTGVVLQGFSYSEGLTAQVRVVRQDGTATAWIPMYLVRSASDDGSFLAGYPGAVVRSGYSLQPLTDVPPTLSQPESLTSGSTTWTLGASARHANPGWAVTAPMP